MWPRRERPCSARGFCPVLGVSLQGTWAGLVGSVAGWKMENSGLERGKKKKKAEFLLKHFKAVGANISVVGGKLPTNE